MREDCEGGVTYIQYMYMGLKQIQIFNAVHAVGVGRNEMKFSGKAFYSPPPPLPPPPPPLPPPLPLPPACPGPLLA